MKRTEIILIRVSEKEKEQIREKAESLNLDMSNYIRFIILNIK